MNVFSRWMKVSALSLVAVVTSASPALAADDLAFPAWRSLRDATVNMRVGPGEDYAIRFVYHRQGLPMKVLRLYQGWYLVEDPEGARGWIMMRFMNKTRTVLVRGAEPLELHSAPGQGMPVAWRLAPGVVGKLGSCKDAWCQVDVNQHVGFAPEINLFGAGKP